VRDWQRRSVHLIGEDRLGMKGVDQADRFVCWWKTATIRR
jgi:hypothetical protein